jgi:hypothetical protein
MRATPPDMRRAAPIRQNRGRPLPHVPPTITSEGTTPIMHDGTDIRIPTQRQPAPAHKLWCTNHIPGEDASDPGTCMTNDLDAGPGWAGLSANEAGIRIDFGITGDGSNPDEAERFALAILCQVARARGVDLPPSALSAVNA